MDEQTWYDVKKARVYAPAVRTYVRVCMSCVCYANESSRVDWCWSWREQSQTAEADTPTVIFLEEVENKLRNLTQLRNYGMIGRGVWELRRYAERRYEAS